MCECSGKLVAWLDGELPAEQAVEVERHLESCAECRGHVDGYQRVSADLEAFCEKTLATSTSRGTNPWTAAAAAAGAAATLVALFLVWPRPRVQTPPMQALRQAPPALQLAAESAAVAPIPPAQKTSRQRAVRRASIQKGNATEAQIQSSYFAPQEPVIEIAIPAEDMFPPGAVPEGMHFVADVTISPDGSAERMRLRPRLAGFERSTIQP